jgi:hypothetical protein
LIFLAVLVERGVDENRSLESRSFDELIGELKATGISVPKSGTLRALNKQRVIAKHDGQLAEPATVENYAGAAQQAIDSVLHQIFQKRLSEIFITELT